MTTATLSIADKAATATSLDDKKAAKTVDKEQKLLNLAVRDINKLNQKHLKARFNAVGEYVVKTFFASDPSKVGERDRTVTFRKLAKRDDLDVSFSYVWRAAKAVALRQMLSEEVANQLNVSQQFELVTVMDDEALAGELARWTVKEQPNRQELVERVSQARNKTGGTDAPEQRTVPPFVRAMTRLYRAIRRVEDTEVDFDEVECYTPEEARSIKTMLDDQIARATKFRDELNDKIKQWAKSS